jgi:hypothetical protein
MATQLELLREALKESEARSGPDNPYVQGLKAQIAMHERNEWRKANGGWWGDNRRFLDMPCTPGGGRK